MKARKRKRPSLAQLRDLTENHRNEVARVDAACERRIAVLMERRQIEVEETGRAHQQTVSGQAVTIAQLKDILVAERRRSEELEELQHEARQQNNELLTVIGEQGAELSRLHARQRMESAAFRRKRDAEEQASRSKVAK